MYNFVCSTVLFFLVTKIKLILRKINQSKNCYDRRYPESVLNYTGDILLVGINYDKNSKKHQCIIEKYRKN